MRTENDFRPSDDDLAAQEQVVLAALQAGSKTTIELRRLGVMSPASRVYGLRKKCMAIRTTRDGRQGRYTLITEGGAS